MDAFNRCKQHVALIISEQTDGLWLLSKVYTGTKYRTRRMLSSEISRIMSQGLPSLIVRNFNCIVRSHEKKGSRQHVDSIDSREFREFIGNVGLIDIGYSGPRFTLCNNQQ